MSCIASPPPYDRIFALYRYQAPFDDVIRALKFGRLDYLGRAIGRTLWDAHAEELSLSDCVVPVPLPWLRLARRGFNQAEVIARAVAAPLGLEIVPALGRRGGQPQSQIEEETQRRRNAKRTFHLTRRYRARAALGGRRILLVDDMVTSGATVRRCAQLLRRAGAAGVTVVAAAQKP